MKMMGWKAFKIITLNLTILAIIRNGQCQYGNAKNKGVVVETEYQKPVIETNSYEEPVWKEEPEYQPEIIKEEQPSYKPKEVIVSEGTGGGYGGSKKSAAIREEPVWQEEQPSYKPKEVIVSEGTGGGYGGGSKKSAAIRQEPIWQEEQPSYKPKEVIVSQGTGGGYGGGSKKIWNEQPQVWKEDYHQQPKVITKVIREPVVVTKVVKQPVVKVIRVVEKVPVYKQPVYHQVWVKKTYSGGYGNGHGGGHGGGYGGGYGGGGYGGRRGGGGGGYGRRRRSITFDGDDHSIDKRASKWRDYKKQAKWQTKQAKWAAKQEKRDKWKKIKKGDFDGGYEQPKHHGYEQPKHHGYEQPKHHGYEQPKHHGYEQPKHHGYEQPKGYGHRARRSYDDAGDTNYDDYDQQQIYTKQEYDQPSTKVETDQQQQQHYDKTKIVEQIYEEETKSPIQQQPEYTPELKDYNANQQVAAIQNEEHSYPTIKEESQEKQTKDDDGYSGYGVGVYGGQIPKIMQPDQQTEEKQQYDSVEQTIASKSEPEQVKQESYPPVEEKKVIEYQPTVTEQKTIKTKEIITTTECNQIMDNLLEHLQPEFMQHMSHYVINNVEPIRMARWGRIQLHDGRFNHMGTICRGDDFHSKKLGQDKYMIEGTIRVPEPTCEFEADAGMYNRLRIRNQCVRLVAKDATFRVAMFVDQKRSTVHVAELEPLELNDFHMEDERGRTVKTGMRWPFKRVSQWQLEPHRQQFMTMLTHELCDKFREMIHRPQVTQEIIQSV